MKVWYCHADSIEGGWLVASPSRDEARALAVVEMGLDADFELRAILWGKEIESEKARALTKEESVGLGLRMLEEWEL